MSPSDNGPRLGVCARPAQPSKMTGNHKQTYYQVIDQAIQQATFRVKFGYANPLDFAVEHLVSEVKRLELAIGDMQPRNQAKAQTKEGLREGQKRLLEAFFEALSGEDPSSYEILMSHRILPVHHPLYCAFFIILKETFGFALSAIAELTFRKNSTVKNLLDRRDTFDQIEAKELKDYLDQFIAIIEEYKLLGEPK